MQPHVLMAEAAVSAVAEAMVAEAWKAEEMELMEEASSKAEAKDCVTCCPPALASPSISRMGTMSLSLSLSQSSHMSGFGSSTSELQDSSTLMDRVNSLNGHLIIWLAFLNSSKHSIVRFDVSGCR